MKLNVLLLLFFTLLLNGTNSHADCPDWEPAEAKNRLSELNTELNHHNDLYFKQLAPVISDNEYDALKARFQALTKCYPQLTFNKPENTTTSSQKITHSAFMGSLKKAATRDDIARFIKKMGNETLLVQPKIDGVAIELIYRSGELISASTRGDGNKGQDILRTVYQIPSIPKSFNTGEAEIILHGELFARLDSIEKDSNYSSARHYVAGHISRREPDILALGNLEFFPWQWVNSPYDRENTTLNILHNFGFEWPTMYTDKIKTWEDVDKIRQSYFKKGVSEPFLMDGIVLKLDNYKLRKELGWKGDSPAWAIAWKFPSDTAVTEVTDIDFRVGRTGNITPVLQFKAVSIKGETIRQVSLGSLGNLKRKDIAIGDQISILLKGAATPAFSRVIMRPESRKLPKLPDLKQYNAFTCLTFTSGCEEQFIARLKWFSNRLDLPMIDKKLIHSGAVRSFSDFLKITSTSLKKSDFDRQIRGLSIPQVGESRAKKLSAHFKNWPALLKANEQEIASISQMSDDQVRVLRDYLAQPEIRKTIEFLNAE